MVFGCGTELDWLMEPEKWVMRLFKATVSEFCRSRCVLLREPTEPAVPLPATGCCCNTATFTKPEANNAYFNTFQYISVTNHVTHDVRSIIAIHSPLACRSGGGPEEMFHGPAYPKQLNIRQHNSTKISRMQRSTTSLTNVPCFIRSLRSRI